MKKEWWEEQSEDWMFIGQESWDYFLRNENLEYHKEQPFHDYRTWLINESGIIYEFEDNFNEDNIPYRRYISTYKDDVDRVMKRPFSDIGEYIMFNKEFKNK
jgi:hypothetical protein